MRRLLLLIGLLLPQATFAASQVCGMLLPGNVNAPAVMPVNPTYISPVLDRIQTGIEVSRQSPSASDFAQYAPDWIRQIDNAARSLLDSELRVAQQQRDLQEVTACHHLDRVLLLCATDRVVTELHTAFQNNSWGAILRLVELLSFTHQRELQLMKGGTDPFFRDRTWHVNHGFDPAGTIYGIPPEEGETYDAICGDGYLVAPEECDDGNTGGGDGCSAVCTSEMCIFSSDYTEPSASGFGCDAEVMGQGGRAMFEPLRIELVQEQFIEDMLREQQERAAALAQLQLSIDPTAEIDPTGGFTVRTHQTAVGCQDTRGFCEGDASIPCSETATCRAFGAGTCIITDLKGISINPERHTFSLERDHWRVISAFSRLRREQGLARVHRSDLQQDAYIPGTLPSSGELPESQQRRSYYREVSANQGNWEARGFVLGAEPQLLVLDKLKDLQKAIAKLAQFAASRQGLRAMVVRFSYFLLRTCMDRPCSLRLERIVKIALTDECFPYTTGLFAQSSCDNPSWQICHDAIADVESQYTPDEGFEEFDPPFPEPTCESP